ncbi:MAG: hypothetical protein HWE22_08870 [Flavobacteriales bacterium]|nr:hypothetical protein [Flavobacteriales bacterium]
MQYLARILTYFILLPLLAVSACTLKSAQVEKNPSITIASDFLHSEDSVLFENFAKRHDLKIIIRHLSLNEIISEVETKGYNSGIDMVFSENTRTPIELNKKAILQNLMEPENKLTSQNRYISYRHNFVGVGLDPFVVIFKNDSLKTRVTYDDFTTKPHYHTLSKADVISFLSPMRRKQDRIETYNWASQWDSKSIKRPEKGPWKDSVDFIVCKYSQLNSFEDSLWQHAALDPYFPNQNKSGVYFDLTTVAIIRQAEHYSDAQKLIDYFQNPGFNAVLNRKIDRFPVYDYLEVRKEGPKFYPSNIDEQLKYYDVIDRMLDKINE